jgi:hypothetical protein
MAGLLPIFPAGLWLMAASMLIRITRFARFSLISPASALVLIRWVGRLYRSGFRHGVATGKVALGWNMERINIMGNSKQWVAIAAALTC